MILDREPKIKTAPTTTEEEEKVTIVAVPYTSRYIIDTKNILFYDSSF